MASNIPRVLCLRDFAPRLDSPQVKLLPLFFKDESVIELFYHSLLKNFPFNVLFVGHIVYIL